MADPLDRMLAETMGALTDVQLREMLIVTAATFRRVRDEVERRGLWDEWKKTPVGREDARG